MKNLSEIRKERKAWLTFWTVGDITENWASERVACIAVFRRTGWRKRRHRKGVILWKNKIRKKLLEILSAMLKSPQRSVGVRPTHFEGQQVVETSCRSAKNADRV